MLLCNNLCLWACCMPNAKNGYASVAERTEQPEFLRKPDDVETTEQEDCRFETEITAKPPPIVEWYQGDKKLKPSKRVLYEEDGNKYALVIKETLLKEAGPYTVKASNTAGTQSATAELRVNGEALCTLNK